VSFHFLNIKYSFPCSESIGNTGFPVNRKYRVSYTISENTYKSVSYRISPSYLKDPTARSGILK